MADTPAAHCSPAVRYILAGCYSPAAHDTLAGCYSPAARRTLAGYCNPATRYILAGPVAARHSPAGFPAAVFPADHC